MLKTTIEVQLLGTRCVFSVDILEKQSYIESSLYDHNKYILYELKGGNKMYWVLPATGSGRLQLSADIDKAAAFTFVRGRKRKRPPLKSLFTGVSLVPNATFSVEEHGGILHPNNVSTLRNFFDLVLGTVISKQLENLPGPPDLARLVTDMLDLNVDKSSKITATRVEEEITSASAKVELLHDTPLTFLSAPLQAVSFEISSPRTEDLSIDMHLSWSYPGSEATFPLSKQLDMTKI